jgi:non-ribosomal peptide synthetase component E (peptide arylation enzyme)
VAKYVNSTGTMYTWVRDCATDNPLAPAIEAQGRRLSYEELLDLVDRLAARLVEACARPPRAVRSGRRGRGRRRRRPGR